MDGAPSTTDPLSSEEATNPPQNVASPSLSRHNIVSLVCPHCSKIFTGNASTSGVRSNYTRHLRRHTGERPYVCRYCQQGFTTRHNQRRHTRLVHPDLVTPSHGPADSVNAAPGNEVAAQRPPSPLRLAGQDPPPLSPLPGCNLTQASVPSPSIASPLVQPPSPQRGVQKTSSASLPSSPLPKLLPCRFCAALFPWKEVLIIHEESCHQRCGASPLLLPLSSSSVDAASLPAFGPRGFTCEDCELEVSSQAKLRRHRQYYCPFRDDVLADPLQTMLSSSGVHPGREVDVSSASSEEERRLVERAAQESGLRFYECANDSSSSGDRGSTDFDSSDSERMDAASYQAVSCDSDDRNSSDYDASNADTWTRCRWDDEDEGSPYSSDASTGTVVGKNDVTRLALRCFEDGERSPRRRRRRVGYARAHLGQRLHHQGLDSTALEMGDLAAFGNEKKSTDGERMTRSVTQGSGVGADDAEWSELSWLLRGKRRRSGHRRERRIIARRLQGRVESSRLLALRRKGGIGTGEDLWSLGLFHRQGHDFSSPPTSPPAPLFTPELQQQGTGIAMVGLQRRQSAVRSSFICPYCDDFTTLANRRTFRGHIRRHHPAEMQQTEMQLSTTGAELCSSSPPEDETSSHGE